MPCHLSVGTRHSSLLTVRYSPPPPPLLTAIFANQSSQICIVSRPPFPPHHSRQAWDQQQPLLEGRKLQSKPLTVPKDTGPGCRHIQEDLISLPLLAARGHLSPPVNSPDIPRGYACFFRYSHRESCYNIVAKRPSCESRLESH